VEGDQQLQQFFIKSNYKTGTNGAWNLCKAKADTEKKKKTK